MGNDPLKVLDGKVNFNVTSYERVIDGVSGFTLQLTFQKLPLVPTLVQSVVLLICLMPAPKQVICFWCLKHLINSSHWSQSDLSEIHFLALDPCNEHSKMGTH